MGGTLTSQPFVVGGTRIRFRVGGGCNAGGDHWNPVTEHIGGGVYIELLVDGLSVVKTTGRCSESMRSAHWDVAQYVGRTAQIRIVDRSSASWGHINVDDIRFNWDVVPERTPNAGAAYVFRRHLAASDEPCSGSSSYWPHAHLCQFELQSKLQASDKRSEDMFGFSVDIDDTTGLVVAGAKHQVALDTMRRRWPVHQTWARRISSVWAQSTCIAVAPNNATVWASCCRHRTGRRTSRRACRRWTPTHATTSAVPWRSAATCCSRAPRATTARASMAAQRTRWTCSWPTYASARRSSPRSKIT